ncbi:hypothetical protein [Streptomyces harbinensis]|uniref:hypothetical protein n=1 Tax=Streptomyces harbinensis TaxID=1176198 RepID=UPI003685651B
MNGIETLADRITAASRDTVIADSRARGADWRLGIVTAVQPGGTVDCGPIRLRCLESYLNPAVGDQIVMSRSGAGSWVALGRTARSAASGWTPYAPAWTGTTNPGLGNGSIAGRFQQLGRLVAGTIVMTIGSTTTGGSGGWEWSLPVPSSPDALMHVAVCEYLRTSTNTRFDGHGVVSPAATAFGIYLPTSSTSSQLRRAAAAGPLSPASGATFANSWSSGDTFRLSFQYEA